MLDSGIEWKIHFRGKTVEALIFNIFCMSWLRDGYPTILKPACKPREVFETSALWPGNVCQACPFAVKVGWAAAEALSKKKHSKLEVQKIHVASGKRYMLHPFCCLTYHHLSCHFAYVQLFFRRFLDQGVKRTIRSTNSWRRCCRTGHVFWGTVITVVTNCGAAQQFGGEATIIKPCLGGKHIPLMQDCRKQSWYTFFWINCYAKKKATVFFKFLCSQDARSYGDAEGSRC